MDLSQAQWRKSTYSGSQTNCVEVAILDGWVAARDSKDRSGPVLVFDRAEWTAFLDGVRLGQFASPVS